MMKPLNFGTAMKTFKFIPLILPTRHLKIEGGLTYCVISQQPDVVARWQIHSLKGHIYGYSVVYEPSTCYDWILNYTRVYKGGESMADTLYLLYRGERTTKVY